MTETANIPDTGACDRCGEELCSPNIEAWELTGDLICDECAEATFEEMAALEEMSEDIE